MRLPLTVVYGQRSSQAREPGGMLVRAPWFLKEVYRAYQYTFKAPCASRAKFT